MNRMASDASEQPGDAAGDREQEALGHEMTNETSAAGAERAPHRHLLAPAERARQQQVGDVGAGDQQHERDGAEQDGERAPHFADHLFLQRHDAERQAAVGRIELWMIAPQVVR